MPDAIPKNSPTTAAGSVTNAMADTEYDRYLIGSRLEIAQILGAIMRQRCLITVTVSEQEFFLTSIVKVDEPAGWLMLECDRDARYMGTVVNRQRLPCNTMLDKVKIQFTCRNVEIVQFEGHATFKAALPEELLRLQRRDFYRMATPVTTPVKCTLSTIRNGKPVKIDLSLIDISCGGISVVTPPELFVPEMGASYDCVLHLPGTLALPLKVQARNAFAVELANGKLSQRSGFVYLNLRESMHATIQRYIRNLERARPHRHLFV